MRSIASIFVIVVLSALAGGRAAAIPWRALVSVFLRSGVTDAERGDVERMLRATAGVRGVEHESREQAYARSQQQFRDAPDVVAATRPESLPESFRVTVADGTCAEAYLAAFDHAPGVSGVVSVPVAGRGGRPPGPPMFERIRGAERAVMLPVEGLCGRY